MTAFAHPDFGRAFETVAEGLFEAPSSPDLFNPYGDRRPGLDREDAAEIRRANLRAYFAAYAERPPLFLLAEAPGPWGCRFSGVPITSEAQLLDPGIPLSGRASSTAESPHDEYSANIFWRLLAPHFPHFFVWNTVPLHPHPEDEPLRIRTPRMREIRTWAPLAEALVTILKPARVLAVGRKAERALGDLGVGCTYVRHPSQGGATLFREGVASALAELDIPYADREDDAHE